MARNTQFRTQTVSSHVLLDSLREQGWIASRLIVPGSLYKWNILAWFRTWRNRRIMIDLVGSLLDRQIHSQEGQGGKPSRRKYVMDLALKTYRAESEPHRKEAYGKLDPIFRQYAIDQMLTFIFAGHDTTSSTIAYVYHMLSLHPDIHGRVIEEHNEVFGAEGEDVAKILAKDPYRLNKLEITTAVIKEVLRLYPPASSIRKGNKGLVVFDQGKMCPTDGYMVWFNHLAMHRNANLFVEPNRFMPDRFLTSNDGDLARKDGFRPFEKGGRMCIGLDLAMIETKIILVMTLRRFDVRAAYEELDSVAKDGSGWPRGTPEDSAGELGGTAYQTLRGSAKPRQGMPARVRMRTA